MKVLQHVVTEMVSRNILFTLSFMLIVQSLLSSRSISAHPHHDPTKSSPVEFLKQLQGSRKGDKGDGVRGLKQYLKRYGYLNYNQYGRLTTETNNDDFDDLLEHAVKTYQLNYHLKPTGTLDSETVKMMMVPRCGVADIINGTTQMRSGKGGTHHSSNLRTVAHYEFFDGNPRWLKSHLTYGFLPQTPADAVDPVSRAFATWASVTHFTFSLVQDYTTADIKIGFRRGEHGDGRPFDGPGGALAHAFQPSIGIFHFDADERWSVGPASNSIDVGTVALHEIGHLLGLAHTSVEEAVMFPSIGSGITKGLHQDDVAGIRALYNV